MDMVKGLSEYGKNQLAYCPSSIPVILAIDLIECPCAYNECITVNSS